jgi:hypothetical protein
MKALSERRQIIDDDRRVIREDHKQRGFLLFSDFALTAEKQWLVRGLLGQGESSTTYGIPGSGKSVLIEDLCLHVAGCRTWLGRDVHAGAVVYVALERAALVERRAIAFREYHQIKDLPFAVVRGVYDLRTLDAAKKLLAICGEVKRETDSPVVLIVIDTLSRALAGGDENSSKDMGAIVTTTARLQQQTGAHVMFLHHMPHDGDRMRGHGALLGAMDTTLHVVKHHDTLRTATVVKSNDSPEGEQVSFTLESVTIGEDTTAPVVLPTDAVPQKRQRGGWTKGLRLVQEAITDALADGKAFEHMIPGGPTVRAVHVEDARSFHRQRYVHGGDGDRAEAERKAWRRNLQTARNQNLIGSGTHGEREIIWLP